MEQLKVKLTKYFEGIDFDLKIALRENRYQEIAQDKILIEFNDDLISKEITDEAIATPSSQPKS